MRAITYFSLLVSLSIPALAQNWQLRENDDDRQIAREKWFYGQRAYPAPTIPAGARLDAFRKLQQINSAARQQHRSAAGEAVSHALTMDSANWTLIGPKPTGGGSAYVTSGRVNAIAIDPRDNNVVYIGAAEGGVWKTTDGGTTWKALTDGQASLATGAIVIDPNSPDTVYVGTGEENFAYDSYYGAGILKSTDGGATWTNIVGPFLQDEIGALAISSDSKTLLCTTTLGVWRSTDGGSTWSLRLSGTAISVVFDPTNSSSVYATVGSIFGSKKNGVYHSTDGGVTWTLSNGTGATALPNTNTGRIEIAMAPSNPAIIYAQIQDASTATWGELLGIYKTTDGGATWNKLPLSAATVALWGPQLWFDNTIRVNPTDPNNVWAGALQIYRSLDGGNTWTPLAQAGSNGSDIHVDFHALAFSADGTKLYIGNDGGIYSTTDIAGRSVNWAELNDTLTVTEFYPGMAIDPANPLISLVGAQDNSTQLYSGDVNWTRVACGDGAYTVIDPAFPVLAYTNCGVLSGASIVRTLQLSTTSVWLGGSYGINQTDPSPFIGPLVMDPANTQTLYFGTYRLWRSLDSAGRWNAVSSDLTGGKQAGTFQAIAVAPSDSNTIYITTSNGKVQVSRNILSGASASWSDISAGLPGRTPTYLAVDPLDAATAYVTYSGFTGVADAQGHVFKTTNAGAAWTDISGNLPNTPVSAIVVDPDLPGTIYIGTDVGVMVTTNGGTTWSSLGNGMPNVVVQALVLDRGSRVMRAATHGRGVWEILAPLPAASVQPSIRSVAPASVNPGNAAFSLSVTGANFTSGTVIRWNGQNRTTTFVDSGHVTAQIQASDVAAAGRALVAAFNPVAGGGSSNAVAFLIGSGPQATTQSIVSAANPLGGNALAPRSIATIYGVNLASQSVVADLAPPLPATLGDTTLTMLSGVQTVPLFYVSPTQISFQVPLIPLGTQQLTITQGVQSITVPVQLVSYAPAIFTTNEQGSGQAAVLIANTASIAAPTGTFPNSRPAQVGEYISIFCTGLGDVANRPALGAPSPQSPLATTLAQSTVTIGSVNAPVSFSGLAPGYVGLYQVNVQVPAGAPTGAQVPVVLTIGGVTSNTVQIAVDPGQ